MPSEALQLERLVDDPKIRRAAAKTSRLFAYLPQPPLPRRSLDLILRAIAYRIQENTHGGIGLATKRRLNALAEELEAKGAAHFDAAIVLKPGTKLVREWHGRSHTVMVTEDGFEFDGQRYRSLIRVARLITGVHWSGPVFFGLKPRPRAAVATAP